MKKTMKFYTLEEVRELSVIKKLPVHSLERKKAINSFSLRYSRKIDSVYAKLWYMSNKNTPFKRQGYSKAKRSNIGISSVIQQPITSDRTLSIKIKGYKIIDGNLIISY